MSDDNLKFLLDMIQRFMKPAEAGEKSLNRVTEDRITIRRIGSLEGQNLIDEDYDIDECNNEIAVYTTLLTSGRLNSYLADIDEQATEMMFRLVEQMAEKEGVT